MEFDDIPPLLIDTSESNPITEPELPKVPVTILAGYLGSGKSTLLRHLTKVTDKKIAIVLNEFGSTSDIERSITVKNLDGKDVESEQWIELDNGCMCCTAKDAGVVAIEKLMKKNGRFDYIIIETSGVADPAPIANSFWLDNALMASVKLDSVVTVLDAQTILKTIEEGPLAELQIACADIIVINKCDTIANEEVLNKIKQLVKGINGAAKIFTTSHGQLDPKEILDANSYDNHVSLKDVEHVHKHAGLSTLVINLHLQSMEDLKTAEAKLQTLLWDKKINGHEIEIHRTKGKLQLPNATFIVQGVREVYEIVDTAYESGAECKIVFIGKGLQPAKQDIEQLFK